MLFCNAKNRTMKTGLLFRMTIDYSINVKKQVKTGRILAGICTI